MKFIINQIQIVSGTNIFIDLNFRNLMNTEIFMESEQSFEPQDSQIITKNKKQASGSQILPAQCSTLAGSQSGKGRLTSDNGSDKRTKSWLAGKKARQKKKKYIEDLETEIKQLQSQIHQYDEDLLKTKNSLNQALNSTKNNQNSLTYSELQLCTQSEDPNEDKINLLLDMIRVHFDRYQFRIGATGKERQAKMDYFFKQLINTFFPALHRYLMYCAIKQIDIFQNYDVDYYLEHLDENFHQETLSWSKQIMESIQLTQEQKTRILGIKCKFYAKKKEIQQILIKLNRLRQAIRQQEESFEQIVALFRKIVSPVQSAKLVLFCQKYKFKKEISLQQDGLLMSKSRKKLKIQ